MICWLTRWSRDKAFLESITPEVAKAVEGKVVTGEAEDEGENETQE